MQVLENATIVGRSRGENDIIVVLNEINGTTLSLLNPNSLDLEVGSEGVVEFDALSAQLISFEPAMVEAMA
jgi:hypothetical protein